MRAGAPAVERIVAHYRLPIREDVVRNRASGLGFVGGIAGQGPLAMLQWLRRRQDARRLTQADAHE
jgi:hypothetical protein